MPLYEYACGECGSHLEVRQRMTEDPMTTCPRCETDALQRLVSMSSFALKGGGWYADGYGSKKADAQSESKADGSKSEGSKAESSKGDAKASEAPKKETKASESTPKAAANG